MYHILHLISVVFHNDKRILLKSTIDEIDVSTQTELEVTLTADTTYTLIVFAFDENISVSKDITVRVLQEVTINDFSSDTPQTLESQPVELRWNIENANKIMLYPNDIDVTQQSSIKIFPNRTTTYSLIASNAISQKEQMLTIGVRPLPRLDVKVSDSLSRLHIPTKDAELSIKEKILYRISSEYPKSYKQIETNRKNDVEEGSRLYTSTWINTKPVLGIIDIATQTYDFAFNTVVNPDVGFVDRINAELILKSSRICNKKQSQILIDI